MGVEKGDCINNVDYTPYISYVFVDEKFRGNRLSQVLIEKAEGYLKSQGFHEVFVVSHFDGFYEKYGYVHIDTKPAYWGETQKIYRHKLS